MELPGPGIGGKQELSRENQWHGRPTQKVLGWTHRPVLKKEMFHYELGTAAEGAVPQGLTYNEDIEKRY